MKNMEVGTFENQGRKEAQSSGFVVDWKCVV